MLIILIEGWQLILSYLIPMPLLNQANHAIVVYKALLPKCSLLFPWVWKWMPPKKKKELVCFRPRPQDKRRRQNRLAAKEWASKLAESDMGSYYNQESSWKTSWNYRGIVFHEFVSERSELFSSQARGEVTRGPAPYKNRTKYCFEILFSGKEASRKTPGSGLLSIFPGKCRTFRKCIE